MNLMALWYTLPKYRHYNGINTDLFARIKALNLENSIVITTDNRWQGMDIAATLFDPDFKKVIFIKELPDNRHLQVLEEYPSKKVYRIVGNNIALD